MDNIIAKVIRIDLDIYILKVINNDNDIITAKLRGNIKKSSNVLVGDLVEVEKVDNDYMITNVLERKNSLIRPPVSNIDQMIIVVSVGEPAPDFILLDKQIILCMAKDILPIICVNKVDLQDENVQAKEDIEYIKSVYGKLGIQIVYTSTVKNIGIEELKQKLIGKTSAFSGNSGVGKSSITKEILDLSHEEVEIGNIGRKSKRGRHTTKAVRLYSLDENTFILDTPGFSSYELYDIDHKKIREFYPEFEKCKCDYDDCMHISEDESVCDVKRHVENNDIDQKRYERYVYIFLKEKEKYDKRYK